MNIFSVGANLVFAQARGGEHKGRALPALHFPDGPGVSRGRRWRGRLAGF